MIFRKEFPKLEFAKDCYAFLLESVVLTIEIKSKLTKHEFRKANKASRQLKSSPRAAVEGIHFGFRRPIPLSYVVAYDGPARMSTVRSWVDEHIDVPTLPLNSRPRFEASSPSLDGVFVLGKGAVLLDNLPINVIQDEHRKERRDAKWITHQMDRGSLLLLFLAITTVASNIHTGWCEPAEYLANVKLDGEISFD